jgi:tetratricopeptide (TPR) repeat protein
MRSRLWANRYAPPVGPAVGDGLVAQRSVAVAVRHRFRLAAVRIHHGHVGRGDIDDSLVDALGNPANLCCPFLPRWSISGRRAEATGSKTRSVPERALLGVFMIPVHRIGFILAAMLLVNSFVGSLAIAQQDEAAVLSDRAGVLYRAGKFADAEPLFKQALAIREKTLDPDDPNLATSLNNLAELYRVQGRYADAEPLYKRALAIYEKVRGPDNPNVATLLNNLALLYTSQSRYADAEPLYKRSLAIREKSLGPDHPNVARALNNLAGFYRIQGRYADAEPLDMRALALWEKRSVPTIPMSRKRSMPWLRSTIRRVATPTPNRSASERWRSGKKRSVLTIPMSRHRSTT